MRSILLVFVALLAVATTFVSASVSIDVAPNAARTPLAHFWKRCFGSGHASLALRADWQAQLLEMRRDIGMERVRFHGIFDDDLSVVLDAVDGYQFFNIDQIYKPIVEAGMKPIVELSFMPRLLAKCVTAKGRGAQRDWQPCSTVMHYEGVVMPPANFSDWTNLVSAFATHLVDTFGLDEVRTWHFEVWNELWGMPYEASNGYLPLYDASYAAIKGVDKLLQIGGPVTMQCSYIAEFTNDRAGKFDFVSTHLYPTDPNCTAPGNRGDIDCFANTIKRARAMAPADKPFFMTEYNAGLFNTELLYSSYAAAFIFRNVPLLHDVLDVWSYWTFSDIFEESGMWAAPFAGFNYGAQTARGVKKPVYRAFQLLKDIGDTLVSSTVQYTGGEPSANATVTSFTVAQSGATQDNSGFHVFVSNFAPEGFAIVIENVTVAVPQSASGACPATATLWLIDGLHANPHEAYVAMGSPGYPTDLQHAKLVAASEMIPAGIPVTKTGSQCTVAMGLMPYAAARIDFPAAN